MISIAGTRPCTFTGCVVEEPHNQATENLIVTPLKSASLLQPNAKEPSTSIFRLFAEVCG
jgi:hypothetical protein